MINWTNPNLKLRQATGFGATLVDHNGSNPKFPHRVFVEVARPAKWMAKEPPSYLEVFNDDGLNAEGTIRLEQVKTTPADARPPRDVINTDGWQPGRSIPLVNGTIGTFRRLNHMKAVSSRGRGFQIVGTYPTKLLGIIPFNAQAFWNDDGTASNSAPDINTKHKDIRFRKVAG